MKKIKVGIVGINGKYGKWLKNFFERQDCFVVGTDITPPNSYSLKEIVKMSEVVIFSIPIDKAVAVVLKAVPFSHKTQLWLDITSIKEPIINAMLKSRAEVVGMHPMCAPPKQTTLAGQTLVVCPSRIKNWSGWFKEITKASQAKIKISSPEEHDKYMAVVQGLPHAVSLIMSSVVKSLGLSPDEIMDYTSPFYRIVLSLMGRILSQDPELYANIQFCNPNILAILDLLDKEVKNFCRAVKKKEKKVFVENFNAGKNYFGPKNLNTANSLFNNLISYMSQLE